MRFTEEADESFKLTYNHKCTLSVTFMNFLDCSISQGKVKSDPERFKSLKKHPLPQDVNLLHCAIDMFLCYC